MMRRMSFSETIFLFFLALIIFGPKKLPEIARQVGKALNEFRRASNEFKAQIEQEIAHLDLDEKKQTILPPSPPSEGTASRTLAAAAVEASPAAALALSGSAESNLSHATDSGTNGSGTLDSGSDHSGSNHPGTELSAANLSSANHSPTNLSSANHSDDEPLFAVSPPAETAPSAVSESVASPDEAPSPASQESHA